MSPFSRTFVWSLIASGAAQACIHAPTVDDLAEGTDLQLEVLDARGASSDPSAMPRRPQLVLGANPALALSPTSVLLFEGAADAALRSDLERMPLTQASARRLLETTPLRVADDPRIRITPKQTLAPAAAYVVAVPRAALSASASSAFVRELRTAEGPLAGAAVSGAFPADAAAGVSIDLRRVLLTFDGAVAGLDDGVWLEDAAGWAVPAALETRPCEEVDDAAATCAQLNLQRPLEPLARYSLRTGSALHDAHGAEIEAFSATFSTADASSATPFTWLVGGCALDEAALPVGCGLLGDRTLQLRLRPNGPVRVSAQLDAQRSARFSSGQPIELSFADLDPNTTYALTVLAEDAAGGRAESQLSVRTTSELALLSISEIRADPLGSEPAQEYVELLNFGADPIDVRGFTLSDAPDAPGTRIDADVMLPAGAHALVVPNAFDASDPRDAAPAPGALLLRTAAAALTRGGLANSGEPLFLRDQQGRRLSAAPATPAPRPGVCIVRVGDDPRSGAPGSFAYEAEGCTPGR
jgi:hypothetical protein